MKDEYTCVERAAPSQQRKALEIANLFVQSGIGFVPMPVANSAEFQRLAEETIAKMNEMLTSDSSPVGAERREP